MSVSVGPQEYPDVIHPEAEIAPPVAFEPYIPAGTELRLELQTNGMLLS